MNSAHPVAAKPPDSAGQSERRYKGILAAASSAVLSKGTLQLVGAATVPIAVRYLGSEGYGLWTTINSAILMFFFLDIGIANTLTNLVSEAFAADDRERATAYFTTAFWSVCVIAIAIGVMSWLAWPYIDWVSIFHVRDAELGAQVNRAVGAALVVFLFAFPAGLAARVLAGYQELHLANLFATGGSILSLISFVLVIRSHGTLPTLVAAYAGCTAFLNWVCLGWVCIFHRPWLKPWPSRFHTSYLPRIFHSGGQFFLIQIAGVIVFNSDNLVISHYLSPAEVTPYNVTWRLAILTTLVQGLSGAALWPAYAESYARGDIVWIRKAYARNRLLTFAVLGAGCGILLLAGRSIIRVWAGSAAVPSFTLVALMCVWMVMLASTTNQALLLGATSRLGKQAAVSIIAAILNLGLSILWVKSMGSVGVILATIVSYLLIVVGQTVEVNKILHSNPAVTDVAKDSDRALQSEAAGGPAGLASIRNELL